MALHYLAGEEGLDQRDERAGRAEGLEVLHREAQKALPEARGGLLHQFHAAGHGEEDGPPLRVEREVVDAVVLVGDRVVGDEVASAGEHGHPSVRVHDRGEGVEAAQGLHRDREVVAPLDEVEPRALLRARDGRLGGVDLARRTGAAPESAFHYRAEMRAGEAPAAVKAVAVEESPNAAVEVAP